MKKFLKYFGIFLVAIILLYTASGFFLVPYALKNIVPKKLEQSLNLHLNIQNAKFNPFNLKLDIFSLSLKDKFKKDLFLLDKLHTQVSLSDIFNKNLIIKNLIFTKPEFFVVKDGKNLNLVQAFDTNSTKKDDNSTKSDFTFLIQNLNIKNSNISFFDIQQNFDFKLFDLNYIAKDITPQKILSSDLQTNEKVNWQGNINFQPFFIKGKLQVNDFDVKSILKYYLPKLKTLKLNSNLNFELKQEDKKILLNVENSVINLLDLNYLDKNNSIKASNFKLDNINLNANFADKSHVNLDNLNLSTNDLKTSFSDYKTDLKSLNLNTNINLDLGKETKLSLKNSNLSLSLLNTFFDEIKAKFKTFDLKDINLDLVMNKNLSLDLNSSKISSNAIDINLKNLDKTIKLSSIDLNKTNVKFKNDVFVDINNLKLNNTNLSSKDISLLDLNNTDLNQIIFNSKSNTLSINKVFLSKLKTKVILDKNNKINIIEAFNKQNSSKTKDENSSKSNFKYNIDEIKLSNSNINFLNENLITPLSHEIDINEINLANLNQNLSFDFKADINTNFSNNLISSGKISINPFSLNQDINLQNLDISFFNPYVKNFVNFDIKSAKTNSNLKLNIKDDKIIANGNLNAHDINLIQNNHELFSLKSFDIEEFSMNLDENLYKLKNIKINSPKLLFEILKDKSLNLSKLVKQSESKTKKDTNQAKLNLIAGPLDLTNGKIIYKDNHLVKPYSLDIHDIKIKGSSFDSQKNVLANVKIDATLGDDGYLSLDSKLLPLDIKSKSSFNVFLKNIKLKKLNPYTAQYIAQEFDDGSMSLNLKYDILKNQLKANNVVKIKDLKIGKVVKQKDVSPLPLALAQTFLEDKDNVLEINLPINGNLADPNFSYGGIIFKAFSNLIINIATAPFSIVGSILGIDSKKIESIDYEFSSAKLLPTEFEKLEHYVKLVEKRPQIKLVINPAFDNKKDKTAIQERIIDKQIQDSLTSKKEESYDEALYNMYENAFGADKLQEVLNKAKDTNQTISKESFLIHQLSLNVQVDEKSLHELAQKRADEIKAYLIKKGVNEKSIEINKPINIQSKEWVKIKMDIK